MELLKLGDIVDYRKGFAFKSELYSNEGIRVVRVTDFSLDSIEKNDGVFIPEDESYKKHILQEGDILIQTVGSWANNPNSIVGKVVRVPYYASGSYLNQNIVKIIPHKNIDKDYLFYSMKANKFSIFCVNRGQGAANQASITLSTILRFKFLAHPYEEQVKIGKILATYRRAIEINDRRIELLSSISREIFEEWFVRYRFPGHENYAFHNGIPSESHTCQLRDFVERRNEKLDEWDDLQLIDLSRMKPFTISISDIGNASELTSNVKKVCKFDLVFGSIRSYQGKCGFSPIDGAIAGSVYNFYPKKDYMYSFLLMLITSKSFIDFTTNYSNGTKMPVLNYKDLVRFKFTIIDNSNLYKEFNNIVMPHILEIDNLNTQNAQLKEQMQLMMHRLMSNRLTVK